MALFANLKVEDVLQVEDKTRLIAKDSFVTKGEAAITSVEIEPEAGAGFISVFETRSENWFLDWAYATAGEKVVTVRIDNGSGPVTAQKTINVLTKEEDNLFSSDEDLLRHEKEIMRWLPKGKNSFLYLHRRSQTLIIDWFNKNNYTQLDGSRLTKANIVEIEEVRQWSLFWTLKIILFDASTQPEDVFAVKADEYSGLAQSFREATRLKVDVNGDGVQEDNEGFNLVSLRLRRKR